MQPTAAPCGTDLVSIEIQVKSDLFDAWLRKQDSQSNSKPQLLNQKIAREAEILMNPCGGENMSEADRIKYLRVVLMAVGVTFIVGIYSLVIVWPSGWSWHLGHSYYVPHYLQMILGVYATLGVFLLMASRNPLEHLSLIWFTVWSSVVHAGVMGAQALANPEHIRHLWGDVPILFAVAIALALLTPRQASATLENQSRI